MCFFVSFSLSPSPNCLSLSVKETGGTLAHLPLVAAAIFLVIMWLQWTPSRLRSK